MKIKLNDTPREFFVGKDQAITLKDMGRITLSPDEQVTFLSEEGAEYDLCRKSWGYYATPSLNDRLRRFGYKTALVRNTKGQGFVMLVDEKKTAEFFDYLKEEDNFLVSWLDEEFALGESGMQVVGSIVCPVCRSSSVERVATFDNKPAGENDFNIISYHRTVEKCLTCHHLFNLHNYDIESFYSGHYAQSVYHDTMREKFDKIINLPEGKSDNKNRVKRLISLIQGEGVEANDKARVLDIGSGLCVFLYELSRQTSWTCYALDPDERQAAHARNVCKVETVTTGVMEYNAPQPYDLVTLNKVLEHFEKPEELLNKMKTFLPKDRKGYVYIEVPDGEYAAADGYDREEFFIEHFHAFSYESFFRVMKKCGYDLLHLSRIREPSGKYTLYCLATIK